MRSYWDSSALVAATLDGTVRDRFATAEVVTRTHSMAEVFSTLTGGRLAFRIDADDAIRVIGELFRDVAMVDLSAPEVMDALAEARPRGVRGGQVHDYLHAVAARKANCPTLVTLNPSDFEGLVADLSVESP